LCIGLIWTWLEINGLVSKSKYSKETSLAGFGLHFKHKGAMEKISVHPPNKRRHD